MSDSLMCYICINPAVIPGTVNCCALQIITISSQTRAVQSVQVLVERRRLELQPRKTTWIQHLYKCWNRTCSTDIGMYIVCCQPGNKIEICEILHWVLTMQNTFAKFHQCSRATSKDVEYNGIIAAGRKSVGETHKQFEMCLRCSHRLIDLHRPSKFVLYRSLKDNRQYGWKQNLQVLQQRKWVHTVEKNR